MVSPEFRGIPAPSIIVIIEGLLAVIKDPSVALRVRIAAGKVLGEIGDPRMGALVDVPAGEFIMGDDSDPDTSPRHKLFLSDYKIGKYPVTNREISGLR